MRKPAPRKVAAKRTRRKKTSFWKANRSIFAGALLFFLLIGLSYHYRNGIAYYLGFTRRNESAKEAAKRISDVRNYGLLDKYDDKAAGFDVSQYQGKIAWNKVQFVENTFPLRFVFIRATAGKDRIDTRFPENWNGAGKRNIIRGAYHYYRPNENSKLQADNFIKTVKLQKGDLPPVLDIEKLPKNQPIDSLKAGLRRWLVRIDSHYKAKPIIYTCEKYYSDFLKDEFSEYTFWIANYNFFTENIKDDWQFWQFTEKATVPGIDCNVDINIYNGTPKMLRYLTIN